MLSSDRQHLYVNIYRQLGLLVFNRLSGNCTPGLILHERTMPALNQTANSVCPHCEGSQSGSLEHADRAILALAMAQLESVMNVLSIRLAQLEGEAPEAAFGAVAPRQLARETSDGFAEHLLTIKLRREATQ